MTAKLTYELGQRVSFESERCTIRYIGPVKGTEGDWLGVEWDNSSRGKHDGKGYFKCLSSSPTAASFIRPTRRPDPDRSFVEAIWHKYVAENQIANDGPPTGIEPAPHTIPENRPIVISGKVAQTIGFDKIREQQAKLSDLKIVIVDGMRINRAHIGANTSEVVCPKIVELDLSRNLFGRMYDVVRICKPLEHLRSLKLNGNRLIIEEWEDRIHFFTTVDGEKTLEEGDLKPYEEFKSAFKTVKSLELDETLITWHDLCRLMETFVSATSLSASSNCFKILDLPFKTRTLTSLTLEFNEFTALTDICPLSQLTTLESLILKGNKITSVGTMASAAVIDKQKDKKIYNATPAFHPNLRYVDLSYNKISDYSFIDSLVYVFPGMTSLRVSGNPLYQGSVKAVEEGFMLTLARIANLQTLNFSNVTLEERKNAELFYSSQIGKEMATVPTAAEYTVTSRHKRYAELCQKYDMTPAVPRIESTIDSETLESRLISFTFVVPPNKEWFLAETIHRKEIPKTFDIYRVKGIVGRLLNVQPLRLRLIWQTGEWDPVAGYEDFEDDSSDDEEQTPQAEVEQSDLEQNQKGKLVKREVELEDSTRPVGNLVEGREARVRVELRN